MNIEYKQGGGLYPHIDKRDWIYEDVFGSTTQHDIKPLGRLEKILNSPLAKHENLVYQLNVLSCVPLHITMLNMYYSWFNDGSEVKLSWPMLYALARFYPGAGTSVNNVLSVARDIGECLDTTFPQDDVFTNGGDGWIHNKSLVTDVMKEEGKNWKIGAYTRLRNNTRNSIYDALIHSPVLIGVNLAGNWDASIIRSTGNSMNHLTLLVDVTEQGDYIIWEGFKDNEFDYRVLSKDSYIGAVYSFRDVPDDVKFELKSKTTNNMRLIKQKDKPEIYLLDFSGRLHWYANEESYKRYVDKDADFSHVEEVDELGAYEMGEPINVHNRSLIDTIKFYVEHDLLAKNNE